METTRLGEKPSLNLQRRYPVSPEKVWRAWTDPEAIKRWWGPGGNEPVSLAQLDVRVGGCFRIIFGGPQGTELDFVHSGLFDDSVRDGHRRGWSESLVKLEQFLQSD
jgi:uncharacterized protein YndB with AHSA1/START domain